jgi:hypothetical protein
VSKNEVALAKERGHVTVHLIEAVSGGFSALIWAGFGCVACYCLWQSVAALAGKTTSAAFSSIFKVGADRYVAATVAAVFGGLYKKERGLRKRSEKRMAARIAELEKRLDPGRTTSAPPKSLPKKKTRD